jgi:hypothetical protein
MKRLLIVLGASGLIVAGLTFGLSRMDLDSLEELIPRQWKTFDDLDLVDKSMLQYDSVYGNYLQWTGREYIGPGNPEWITRKLVLDTPNKFAIKSIFKDTTGFFTKIPGNIDFSGRWTVKNEKLILRFYFVPGAWYQLFDSVKNDKVIRLVDSNTIEIDKNAERIWIMNTECQRLK